MSNMKKSSEIKIRKDEIYKAMCESSDRFVNGTGEYRRKRPNDPTYEGVEYFQHVEVKQREDMPTRISDWLAEILPVQPIPDKPNFQPGDLVCLKDLPYLVISYITGRGHIICNYKTSEGKSAVIICFADDLTLIKKG